MARRIKPFKHEKLKWERNRRILISEFLSRRDNTWETKSKSLNDTKRGDDDGFFALVLLGFDVVDEEVMSDGWLLMVLKSRSGNVDQRDLHLLDKRLVRAMDLMGRRKRI